MSISAVKIRRSQQIADELREEILSGRLREGQRLTEAELTARFSVGRGIIRQVLQELTHQGLLVTRPHRGVVVAGDPPKTVRELIVPIRRMIEAHALELIFDELTDADFQRWDDILERMRAACVRKDYSAIAETDMAFHRSLVERSGQADLIAIWEAMAYRIRSHFRRTQRRYADALEIYDEHRGIVDRIRTGPVAVAVELLKEKIN